MPHDELEDFILANKEKIEAASPPPPGWERIEAALDRDEEPDEELPLEAFIVKNRPAFDRETPPPRLKERIFAALDAPAATDAPPAAVKSLRPAWRKRWMFTLGVAASVLLVLAAGFTLGSSFGGGPDQTDLVEAEIHRIDPQFAEAERFFQGEIATQMSRVRAVSQDPELTNSLESINQAADEIRATLLTVPAAERADLVGELIKLYQTKLDILLRIQRHLPASSNFDSPTNQQTTNEL